jgi:hypothetical protein
LLVVVLSGRQVGASAIDPQEAAAETAQCHSAIVRASSQTGVPLRLLQALAPAESGIAIRGGGHLAWPWTLNTNGYGSFHFRSRVAAEAHLSSLLARGLDNVDVGCMQVNWHWHRHAFASPAALLNPENNALYAARLLRSYRVESGSWSGAVGLYHTRNPILAARYHCRIARELQPRAALRDCSR